jgi:hypothetical protein
MNENTTALLEKLATKLGTTSEYLWGVLIRQAAISATTDLIYVILIGCLGVAIWKLHKRFLKKDAHGDTVYENNEGLVVTPMLCAAIIFGFAAIWAFFAIGDIFTAYLNPEYWALKEILDTVK